MLSPTQPASITFQMNSFEAIIFTLLIIGSILLLIGYIIRQHQ